MRVSYQFTQGILSITLYEIPFYLKAEFADIDGYVWKSEKYTITSLNANIDKNSTNLADKVSLIWSSVLLKPKLGVRNNSLVINLGPGISISLKRQNIKHRLEPIIEVEECEDQCECEHKKYALSKCAPGSHFRCSKDIDMIEILRNENTRLRDEIIILHSFKFQMIQHP